MASAGARRSTHLLIPAGVLAILCVAAFTAAPQMGRRTIYVSATDREGKPVAGLTAGDFRIKEDGRLREIDRVAPATEPMQIALLLDDGGPSLGAARQATANFVERLQGKTVFSLTSTGGQPRTRVRFTDDPRQLYRALQNFFPTSAPTTQFLEALVDVARGFVRERAPRPIIVAIVAEGEELSHVRADVVMQTLQQSRAILYYIGLGLPMTSGTHPADYESVQRNIVIGAAPDNSGGRSEQILQPAGIGPLMQQFATELAVGQFSVTYFTNSDRAKLDVETPRPGLRLRAPARVGAK
jgi:hypothetical protein